MDEDQLQALKQIYQSSYKWVNAFDISTELMGYSYNKIWFLLNPLQQQDGTIRTQFT
jgi:lipopolysaccharide biosynthesis regulator YciM